MKKYFVAFVCLIMVSAAFAQESERVYPSHENVVFSSSNGKFVFDYVSHAGIGFAHVTSEDFIPWKWHSLELFTNLVGTRSGGFAIRLRREGGFAIPSLIKER